MACCGTNTWSKVISVFTIIFCLAYAAIQILILLYKKTDYEELHKINKYLSNTSRTNIQVFCYCSVVFNTLWALASITLLIFVRRTETHDYSIKESQKLLKIYMFWNVLGFLSFIPDVMSMIMNGINYNNYSKSESESKSDDAEGSKYMIVLSSRFIVVLVFHILSWIGMIKITSDLQKSLMEDETKPVGRIIPLKPPKPALKPSKVPHLEETNVDRVRDWYKHYEGNENSTNNSNYYSEPEVPKYMPRLNGNVNPAYINNNNYTPTSPPVPAPKPPQHHMPGSNTNVLVNGVTSGTLRRQLPWSYMPQGGELPQRVPRKQPSPVPSNTSAFSGFAPYVPAPDYNENPKQTQRLEFNKPGWSQYL